MLGQEPTNGQQSFRYSRSQSDSNGTIKSVFTESKRVFINKQLQIPLKTTRKYTTEVSIGNGHSAKTETHGHSFFKETSEKTIEMSERTVHVSAANGHSEEPLSLSKEVGNGGTKSLVQQRIESLYGRCDELKVKSSPKSKEPYVNGVEGSVSDEVAARVENHTGSVSPPVFRHLNKDFRKQLQLNIPAKKLNSAKIPTKSIVSESTSAQVGEVTHLNGVGHDECDRIKSITPPLLKSETSFNDKPLDISKNTEREGYQFLNLIDVEKEKISAEIEKLEKETSLLQDIPEDAMGKIRAACGKANLLIAQKFEQFKGLCWKNIEETPGMPFYTTASDLAGFWDMVLLQVDDIHATFKDIHAMKENGWKEVVSEKPLAPQTRIRQSHPNAVSRSNPSTPKRSAKSAEMVKAREEARKQFLAAKKKGRQQAVSADSDDIAIFTPHSS